MVILIILYFFWLRSASLCMLLVLFSHSVVFESLEPYGLYSLPGSSVHGILQARILEWVAIPFSQRSNPVLLNCRQILSEPPGSLFITTTAFLNLLKKKYSKNVKLNILVRNRFSNTHVNVSVLELD